MEEWLGDPLNHAVEPCRDLDVDTCYRDGWALAHPVTGEPPWNEALPYFKDGCGRRHASACAYLGLLYQYGVGVEQNDWMAFALHERACALGDSQVSCFDAAFLLLGRKDHSKADETRAIEWLKRSCDAGSAIACYNRGVYAASDEAGRVWYQRACGLGDEISCNLLTKPPPPAALPLPPAHSRKELPPTVVLPP